MIRIRLTASQAEELSAEFRSARDRKRRDRLQIVLMAHSGRPHQDIAADLGLHRRSVPRWLNADLEHGPSGLAPRPAKGKTPGIPATLSDEARVQMAPTSQATLGVKGHRPVVGTRDCKDVLPVFAVRDLISGALRTDTPESRQKENRKSEAGTTRRMRRAFADHQRHVGRVDPQDAHERVVPTIDSAPWHRGPLIDAARREDPHLEFYRMPSGSSHLNVIGRFWKKRRRRAMHDRLFDTIADLKGSVRNSLRSFQTVRSRLLTLINGRPKKRPK